jgi:hypothetical protein
MLKVPAAAEKAIFGLVRACIAAGGWQRRVAEGVHDALSAPAPQEQAAPPPQLGLWVVDGEGLPPRPWRIGPDDRFDCLVLGCEGVLARTCVTRQLVTEAQRTEQKSRGQGTDYPACDTRKCAQGRGIRAALEPNASVEWSGTGPGKRFQGEKRRKEKAAQDAARARQERAGLLDEVRTLDVDPDPVEE